jgi:hypothetical protein
MGLEGGDWERCAHAIRSPADDGERPIDDRICCRRARHTRTQGTRSPGLADGRTFRADVVKGRPARPGSGGRVTCGTRRAVSLHPGARLPRPQLDGRQPAEGGKMRPRPREIAAVGDVTGTDEARPGQARPASPDLETVPLPVRAPYLFRPRRPQPRHTRPSSARAPPPALSSPFARCSLHPALIARYPYPAACTGTCHRRLQPYRPATALHTLPPSRRSCLVPRVRECVRSVHAPPPEPPDEPLLSHQ